MPSKASVPLDVRLPVICPRCGNRNFLFEDAGADDWFAECFACGGVIWHKPPAEYIHERHNLGYNGGTAYRG